jgi:ABC-type phosphate/phosphonate transport system substrate-binding protein
MPEGRLSALVANARMYSVTPAVKDAWRDLFAWLSDRAGVPLTYVDHAAPAPLEELWSRDDLGAAFMCGFPFASAVPRPLPVAAPIPAPPRYRGRAIYCTDFVVRTDSAFERLSDAFGGRIGWTIEHSQSGCQAVRRHLRRYRQDRSAELFADWVGPLVTPRRVVDAVLAGEIDVGPLDSYWHDLLKRHEPGTASLLRTIEATAATPIPSLIAAVVVPPDIVERLRHALLASATVPEIASTLERLLLVGFAHVDSAAYSQLLAR